MFAVLRPGVWACISLVAVLVMTQATLSQVLSPAVAVNSPSSSSASGEFVDPAVANCGALVPLPICPVQLEIDAVKLINQIRADSGKSQLVWDYRLFIGVRCHSTDMIVNGCFQINDCDGTTWNTKYLLLGYGSVFAQDMATGFATPASVVNAWLTDPLTLHRQVMLNPANTHIAIGYVSSGPTRYWTVAYGSASLAQPLPCSCCQGSTGNVDCDPTDGVDIGDLTTLIDNLFISFSPLCCQQEANCDGDPSNNVDIGDLTKLIDNLFISFAPLPACL